MFKKFDLIVVGSGAAGQSVAYKCQSAGMNVAVVDSRPYGGTCGLRGCDPKKVLVAAAQAKDWIYRLKGQGITGDVQIDWSDLMEFRRQFTDPLPDSSEDALDDAGVETLHGRAQFVDKRTMQIGDKTIQANKVAIASGAKPRDLDIDGKEYLTSSAEFLYLDQLPEHIVFVGGGYISFEFAHIAARAGRKVTIIEKHSTILRHFDPDLVNILLDASKDIGIVTLKNTKVEAIEKTEDGYFVHTSSDNGNNNFEADLVVHGAGRVPEIDDLDLEQAGVKYNKKGVVVSDYLQSVSNPDVYAAGDAADSDGLPLTPIASIEGRVAASNLMNGNDKKPDYTATPSVVFTLPTLAIVGMTESQAEEQGLEFTVNHQETSSWYSSRRVNLAHSGFKVLIEKDTKRILGAHLLTLHAADTINLFALAIRNDLTASDIKRTIFSYPADTGDMKYMI